MTSCRVVFGARTRVATGANGPPHLEVALPTLDGEAAECVLNAVDTATERAGCHVFEKAGRIAGFSVAPPELGIEEAAHELYRRMFAAIAGRPLYRIWNYVPHINTIAGGLENYRRFCRARAEAFERRFGSDFQRHLPAASAVGTPGGPLAIAFLAGDEEPRHCENPQQVPAFEYPADYGPRAPSFSRATLVATGSQRQLFISGTAAIRGHTSIAAGDLAGQLDCTRENLRAIAATAGAGPDFGAHDHWCRALKVYVRHAGDFPAVRRDLEKRFLRAGDRVTYLQAELCRKELQVEIEALLSKPGVTAGARA